MWSALSVSTEIIIRFVGGVEIEHPVLNCEATKAKAGTDITRRILMKIMPYFTNANYRSKPGETLKGQNTSAK